MAGVQARRWALCQNGCGLIDQTRLIPDADDPPGRCPTCKGQSCDCYSCLSEGVAVLAQMVGVDDAGLHVTISLLHAQAEANWIDGPAGD